MAEHYGAVHSNSENETILVLAARVERPQEWRLIGTLAIVIFVIFVACVLVYIREDKQRKRPVPKVSTSKEKLRTAKAIDIDSPASS
ncbi:hypothetical protein Q1695_003435 [Nippostrongylus brasiliensis]|nr:hypothetical protein Q1695_003435 [Nippostrongylus brasiliensis]